MRCPFERGRTLLAAGSIRRRAREKRAARETLDEAHRIFDGLGAGLWAGRARDELARISGRRAADNGTHDDSRQGSPPSQPKASPTRR